MPPLVFLPGAGGSASFWRPVADRLTDLGGVHVFGFPGFGGLPADPGIRSLDDLFGWVVEDRTNLANRLAEIRARTLLLSSDADPISPPSVARFLAQGISGARIVTIAGGTHAFANERPEEVASIIRSHLEDGQRP